MLEPADEPAPDRTALCIAFAPMADNLTSDPRYRKQAAVDAAARYDPVRGTPDDS